MLKASVHCCYSSKQNHNHALHKVHSFTLFLKDISRGECKIFLPFFFIQKHIELPLTFTPRYIHVSKVWLEMFASNQTEQIFYTYNNQHKHETRTKLQNQKKYWTMTGRFKLKFSGSLRMSVFSAVSFSVSFRSSILIQSS